MSNDKLLEKLAKIKAHAESAKDIGNEAEAQAFAGMLQNLLLKHKLEMTDIQYIKEMESEPIIQSDPKIQWDRERKRYFYVDFPDVEVVMRRVGWMEQLAQVVAEYNACRILVVEGRSYIMFVGHKSNVAICEYLFITMLRTADKLSAKAAMKFRREARAAAGGAGYTPGGYRESFLKGFITRIQKRLEDEKNAFGGNTGTALVRVNKEALQVKDYMAGKYKTSSKSPNRGRGEFNLHGYREGQKLADSLELKANAVNSGKPNGQLDE